MILVVGRFTETHRNLIWNENNLCWINPTKDMSLFDVNEFCNRIDSDLYDLDDFLIWTNDKELIDRIAACHSNELWLVEDNSLKKYRIKDIRELYTLPISEIVARNWLDLGTVK